MARWVQVGTTDDVPRGQGRTVVLEGLALALYNDAGRYYATDDACPHQGASLATGLIHEGRVICPLHSWVFDLETGCCPRESHDPVTVYPVRQNAEFIEVALPESPGPGGEHERHEGQTGS